MVEIKAIECPQCGSCESKKLLGNRYKCAMCGSSFIVDDGNGALPIESKENVSVQKVHASVTKNEFLREALLTMASEDSSIDFFSNDFNVEEGSSNIYFSEMSADINYTANIGNDSEEVKDVVESYFDSEEKQYKERIVKKNVTTTTWNALSGKQNRTSKVMLVDGEAVEDGQLLIKKILSAEKVEQECRHEDIEKIIANNYDNAIELHKKAYRSSIEQSLPGDHFEDLTCSIDKYTKVENAVYVVPEYTLTVENNGKTVTKKAVAFGKLEINGDKVVGAQKETDSYVWKKVKGITIGAYLALIASIILCVYSATDLMKIICVPVFIGAVVLFILALRAINKTQKQIEGNYQKDKTEAVNAVLEKYSL